MANINKIWAREILDSRSVPTVEVACQLNSGHIAVASVPSGASTGTHEALELRDNDPGRMMGKGVLKAVDNVNRVLGPALANFDPQDQEKIDKRLIEIDGSYDWCQAFRGGPKTYDPFAWQFTPVRYDGRYFRDYELHNESDNEEFMNACKGKFPRVKAR